MRVLFLDIDGVVNNLSTINRTKSGFPLTDSILLERIARIIAATDAQIVLTSSWRLDWYPEDESQNGADFEELRDAFAAAGLEITDRTGSLGVSDVFFRPYEIQEFLDTHDVDSFVILDDLDMEEFFPEHFVWCDPRFGIRESQVNEIINILI